MVRWLNCWIWKSTCSEVLFSTLNKFLLGKIDNKYVYAETQIAWKESKFGVFSDPYFPVLSPSTGKYWPGNTLYFDTLHVRTSRTLRKNTVILPNFHVWKFCGKAQFPQSFGEIAQNCSKTVSFHKMSTPGNQVKLRYFTQWDPVNHPQRNFSTKSQKSWCATGSYQFLWYENIILHTISISMYRFGPKTRWTKMENFFRGIWNISCKNFSICPHSKYCRMPWWCWHDWRYPCWFCRKRFNRDLKRFNPLVPNVH